MNFTFHKEEHLCGRKAFESLMKEGSSQFRFPFKVLWIKTDYPLTYPAQIAFSVSKKRFKRAHQRNLIKRRLREAYRMNKNPLYQFLQEKEIKIQFLIIYIAPNIMAYHEIEPKIKSVLDSIMAAIQKASK